jgi:uncharacterized protein (TIGR02996 family)
MDESDRQAFLRTILDDPTSDTPRLIFADWLDEHGDHPRAEFIRLQCQIARGFDRPEEKEEAEIREGELLAEHRVEWENELPTWEGIAWETFRRGFISSVRADSPSAFFSHEAEIFAAVPIETLSLHRFYSEDAKALARVKGVRHLRKLDFEDGNAVGNAGIDALSKSPFLRELRDLRLRSNSIGAAGARAIGASRTFANLETLWLDRNDLFEGVGLLAQGATLTSLRSLRLSNTQGGPFLRREFFNSEIMEKLVSLDLDTNGFDDEGAIALAQSERLRNLLTLFLNSNLVGDEGTLALAESPVCKHLRYLFLNGNRIGDPGARALAESPYLEHIQELKLWENRIGAAADQLRARFGSRASVN